MIGKMPEYFCREPLENIKGYAEAMADTTQVWDCHHWNEQWWTRPQLKKMGMYYNRPASELVFVTHKEHMNLKHAGRVEGYKNGGESRKGHVAWNKGKKSPSEVKEKIANSLRGLKRSDETKLKMSMAQRGKHLNEETRKKLSIAHKGKVGPHKGERRVVVSGVPTWVSPTE